MMVQRAAKLREWSEPLVSCSEALIKLEELIEKIDDLFSLIRRIQVVVGNSFLRP